MLLLATCLAHAAPSLPEPTHFDLVRGLGAKRGEVEVNTLIAVDLRDQAEVTWAPEVEWTPARGVGIELELPHDGLHLHGVKGAAQVTLPGSGDRFAHGLQVIGEYRLAHGDGALSALHVAGTRFGDLSLVGLVGARFEGVGGPRVSTSVLANPSLFVQTSPRVVVGVETNLTWTPQAAVEVIVLPQLHLRVGERLGVQLGAGLAHDGSSTSGLLTVRVIVE